MKPTSEKFTTSGATLFTFAFFVMTAPTAHADEYCIKQLMAAATGLMALAHQASDSKRVKAVIDRVRNLLV